MKKNFWYWIIALIISIIIGPIGPVLVFFVYWGYFFKKLGLLKFYMLLLFITSFMVMIIMKRNFGFYQSISLFTYIFPIIYYVGLKIGNKKFDIIIFIFGLFFLLPSFINLYTIIRDIFISCYYCSLNNIFGDTFIIIIFGAPILVIIILILKLLAIYLNIFYTYKIGKEYFSINKKGIIIYIFVLFIIHSFLFYNYEAKYLGHGFYQDNNVYYFIGGDFASCLLYFLDEQKKLSYDDFINTLNNMNLKYDGKKISEISK